eukprot:2096995-Prymnesium_polylepis.2
MIDFKRSASSSEFRHQSSPGLTTYSPRTLSQCLSDPCGLFRLPAQLTAPELFVILGRTFEKNRAWRMENAVVNAVAGF